MRLACRPTAIGLALLAVAMPAAAQNPWGEVRMPSAGQAEAIGGYAGGCVAGAATLPLTGEGFQVMRPSRNRYYGHPELVAFVEQLAASASRQGLGGLLVGDLSQPRGGPATYGHASHQSGLDVDIWFRLLPPDAPPLTPERTEQLPMDSVIRAADGVLDPKRWDRRYGELLLLAATTPEVERIFVNPIIKQALCRNGPRGDWLGKLRPWWGHDAHFHVRVACPADSRECESQEPIPPGDGCDEDLDGWVREIRRAAKRPKPPAPRRALPELPTACQAVLAARPALRTASRPAGPSRVAGADAQPAIGSN